MQEFDKRITCGLAPSRPRPCCTHTATSSTAGKLQHACRPTEPHNDPCASLVGFLHHSLQHSTLRGPEAATCHASLPICSSPVTAATRNACSPTPTACRTAHTVSTAVVASLLLLLLLLQVRQLLAQARHCCLLALRVILQLLYPEHKGLVLVGQRRHLPPQRLHLTQHTGPQRSQLLGKRRSSSAGRHGASSSSRCRSSPCSSATATGTIAAANE